MYTCMSNERTYTYTYIHTYIHIYIYTHTHTYIHIYVTVSSMHGLAKLRYTDGLYCNTFIVSNMQCNVA